MHCQRRRTSASHAVDYLAASTRGIGMDIERRRLHMDHPKHEQFELLHEAAPRTWAREGTARSQNSSEQLLRSRNPRVPGTATLRAAFPCSSRARQPTTWERVGAGRQHAPVLNADCGREGERVRQVCAPPPAVRHEVPGRVCAAAALYAECV